VQYRQTSKETAMTPPPTSLRVRAARWAQRLRSADRREEADRGAGAIEYAGIVILVAAIILAVRALGLPAQISGAISQWVSSVVGGG
jgi:Flp pilus assembly pilin Flp